MATSGSVCWGPECGAELIPTRGRPRKYCSDGCSQRAFRRNGNKAPAEPFPPLEIGTPWPRRTGPRGEVANETPTSAPKPKPGASTFFEPAAGGRDPNEPTVPVPPHKLVLAYEQEVTELGMIDTTAGQKVVELARKLVDAGTSAATSAGLSKELDRLIAELREKSNSLENFDPSNVIRERTLAKLRAVGAAR